MKKHFKAGRFKDLFIMEFIINRQALIIMALSLLFLSLLVNFQPLREILHIRTPENFYLALTVLFIVYSMVFTSTCFNELNSSGQMVEFILLPASLPEKFAVKYLYTTLLFFLTGCISVLASFLIVELFNPKLGIEHIFSYSFSSLGSFSLQSSLMHYLKIHSIIFFGAVYFRKLELVKTVISYLGVFIGLIAFYLLLGVLPVFGKSHYLFDMPFVNNTDFYKYLTPRSAIAVFSYQKTSNSVSAAVLNYVMPVFFWAIAYLRLKESEVRDGV